MNILEQLSKKEVSMDIRYYGIDDMATGIMVKELLDNKGEILEHYQNNKIETLDEYIDYVFLETIMKYYDVIPYVLVERRDEFKQFLDECKLRFENYKIKDEILFINNSYLEIYNYENSNDNHLYIAHDLKDYTSDFIGLHFNSFSKKVIDYVINEATYDVIDSFEIWQKYFVKNPSELGSLFDEINIKKVFNMRFEEIGNILESLKSNDKFSTVISNSIDIIYKIIKDNYFNPEDEQNIWQSYYVLNDALVFLKRMKTPYVYELEKELQQQEVVFNESLIKNGHSSTFEIDLKPFIDFFEDKTQPWELRIAYLTHYKNEQGKLCSFLEHGAKSDIKGLSDELARKNPGTDDYFTSWRLRNLSLYSFEIKARILSILRKKENINEYFSSIYGELKYICNNLDTTMELEELKENVDMLAQFLTDLFINLKEESLKITIKNNIYGCSVLICGLIEKVLRIIYKNSMKEISYIPDSSITLGTLLNEHDKNTNIILDILGLEQIRCLRYYLHKMDSGVGDNVRNDLAHLNGRTPRRLNYDLVVELLSYLSSILNSCVLYYQRKKSDN